jgi:hypothetical protein
MDDYNSHPIGSLVGQNKAVWLSLFHSANQWKARKRVSNNPERSKFSGIGKT